MTFFNFNVLNVNSLECVLMKNQDCKIRQKVINLNTNEPIFYPYSVAINKCSGSCNIINGPHAKLSVPGIIKNINVRVFNLMQRIIQARHIIWHETCKCICRLTAAVCNSKQVFNKDKYR